MKYGWYILLFLFIIRGSSGLFGFDVWNKYTGWHKISISDAIISLIIALIIFVYINREN